MAQRRAPGGYTIGTAHGTPAESMQPNSFNYLRSATTVPWTADPDACRAADVGQRLPRHGHLWLVDGERLVLYFTDTGDFTAEQVARIKDELSHLFLDRSPPGVLDDFIAGMRRVLPDPMCDACARRNHCGRRFRVVDAPPFAAEEAWIAGYVRDLRGDVLDVGCGEQLYLDTLAPLVRAGTVRYTGLDPNEVSLARPRAALPDSRFVTGTIEDFRNAPASYDHILCLRSLNHVHDMGDAIGRMAELLRPGGTLLVVETTPFAMLRRRQQVAAADRAPRAGHQHFRNVASEDVLPLAGQYGLQVLHHRPIGLHATNEWILLLGR